MIVLMQLLKLIPQSKHALLESFFCEAHEGVTTMNLNALDEACMLPDFCASVFDLDFELTESQLQAVASLISRGTFGSAFRVAKIA